MWGRALAAPQPYLGVVGRGAHGIWRVPPPPESALPRQVLDFAAVVGLLMTLTAMREQFIGVADTIDQACRGYLETYHPQEVEELYSSNVETGDA